MAVSTYTTYDAVRVALGVSHDELPNHAIEIETVAFELDEQLLSINATLIDQYTTVADIEQSSRTVDQQTLYRRVRLFGAAAVAWKISSGLPMMAPKDITDGKAALSRFTGTPYADVIARVLADYNLAYQRLAGTVNLDTTLTTTFVPSFAAVGLNRDPVVSE